MHPKHSLRGEGGGGGVPGFNSAQVRTDAPKTLTAGGGGGGVFLVLTVHRFAPMHPKHSLRGGGWVFLVLTVHRFAPMQSKHSLLRPCQVDQPQFPDGDCVAPRSIVSGVLHDNGEHSMTATALLQYDHRTPLTNLLSIYIPQRL